MLIINTIIITNVIKRKLKEQNYKMKMKKKVTLNLISWLNLKLSNLNGQI